MEVYVLYEVPYSDGQSFIYGVIEDEARADAWADAGEHRYIEVFTLNEVPED